MAELPGITCMQFSFLIKKAKIACPYENVLVTSVVPVLSCFHLVYLQIIILGEVTHGIFLY